jgi:hypothetical protein
MDFECGGVRNPGIGDENVEAATDQVAHLRGKHMSAIGLGEIGGNRVGSSARSADLIDYGVGVIGVAAVVDEDTDASSSKRHRSGAAHAARSAGYQGNLVSKVGHDRLLEARLTRPVRHRS